MYTHKKRLTEKPNKSNPLAPHKHHPLPRYEEISTTSHPHINAPKTCTHQHLFITGQSSDDTCGYNFGTECSCGRSSRSNMCSTPQNKLYKPTRTPSLPYSRYYPCCHHSQHSRIYTITDSPVHFEWIMTPEGKNKTCKVYHVTLSTAYHCLRPSTSKRRHRGHRKDHHTGHQPH